MFDFVIRDQISDHVAAIQRADERHRTGPSRRWLAATWQYRTGTQQQGTDVVEIVNDYRDPGEGSTLPHASAAAAIAAYWQLVEGSGEQVVVAVEQFVDLDTSRQEAEMRSHRVGPFHPLTVKLDN